MTKKQLQERYCQAPTSRGLWLGTPVTCLLAWLVIAIAPQAAAPAAAQVPIGIFFVSLHCQEETDESSASDEPYVVVFVANRAAAIPTSLTSRTRVFEDTDRGETKTETVRLWGMTGAAAEIRDRDDLIILVGLMENDGGNPDSIVGAVQAMLGANVVLYTNDRLSRDETVRRLINDMNGAIDLARAGGGLEPDERIGSVQELRPTAEHVSGVSGSDVQLGFRGDDGRYSLNFRIAPEIEDTARGPLLPLVSWYSEERGDNFTTTSPLWIGIPGDRKLIGPGSGYRCYRIEGNVFNPTMAPPLNGIPLYSWYSEARGDNFVTSDPRWAGAPGETKAHGPGSGYRFVRNEGYVYSSRPASETRGVVNLYSWYSQARGDNFATTDPAWSGAVGDTKGHGPGSGYRLFRVEGLVLR